MTETHPAWTPSQETISRSRLNRLIKKLGLETVDDLHRRAVNDPEWYWRRVVEDLGVDFERDFTQVCDTSSGIEFPRWFIDGLFNITTNTLDRYATGPESQKTAIIWEDETRTSTHVSYGELYRDVVRLAGFLRAKHIESGDRVVLFLPMIPETAVAFLACARIGAVVVPVFSGYGVDALATRCIDAEAKMVITADGFRRKDRIVAMKTVADQAADQAPSVQTIVVVDHVTTSTKPGSGRDIRWTDALVVGDVDDADGSAIALDPNHPLLIAYTSGTTGRPKGIVLSHSGFLLKVGHDLGYCFDIQDDDVIFWISDFGWLVGPLLIVGSLFFHSTAVFYEGALDQPDPSRIWELIRHHEVTVQGISPTAVRALMTAGDSWVPDPPSHLRAFVTTGEPWTPEPWMWLFDTVGQRKLPILNFSGGTEIGGGIVSCYTILPLYPCGFSAPVIGMNSDIVDDNGHPVRGEAGELIIRSPWPGMTHSFWRDRERYLQTYWSKFPGCWSHGDLARIDADGTWFITGRSDDTIKVAGKRIGPAEIEAALVTHPGVLDAAAVGVPDASKGQAIVCFVVPRVWPVDGLERILEESVIQRLGRALAPREIMFVEGLPKTKNNKLLRRAIAARYLGAPQGDLSSLDDPSTLDLIPVSAQSPGDA